MNFDTAFTAIQSLIAECGGDSERFAERLRAERIPHLSFSQVSTVEACPYRYYLQYVRGIEPEPVPAYFAKGKLLHQLIARDYSNGHGERAAYEDELALQLSGENLAHLLNALALHRQNTWRGVEVLGVEHPFVMTLEPNLPPMVGVIDLVLKDNDGYLLVDHKTGRNFYPDDELQVAIYAQYIRSAYGGEAARLFYDHYRWVANLERIRKPAFQRVEVRAEPARWPSDLTRIRAAYQIICKIKEIYEEWNPQKKYISPLHDSDMTPLHCGCLRSSPWKSSEDSFPSGNLRNSLLRITSARGECFRCPYRGMCGQ